MILHTAQTWALFSGRGEGVHTLPPKIFACGVQKIKKDRRFVRKVFSISPSSFGRRYGGPWGDIHPHTPTSMSDTTPHNTSDCGRGYRSPAVPSQPQSVSCQPALLSVPFRSVWPRDLRCHLMVGRPRRRPVITVRQEIGHVRNARWSAIVVGWRVVRRLF